MKHTVKTFNKSGRCLYEANFSTAEAAYEEYVKDLKLLKAFSFTTPNDEVTIVRLNEGAVMAMETVKAV